LQDGALGLQLPKGLTCSPDPRLGIGRGEIPLCAHLIFVVRIQKSIAKSAFPSIFMQAKTRNFFILFSYACPVPSKWRSIYMCWWSSLLLTLVFSVQLIFLTFLGKAGYDINSISIEPSIV
jgi:tellurite resistance protein TehA-like permease